MWILLLLCGLMKCECVQWADGASRLRAPRRAASLAPARACDSPYMIAHRHPPFDPLSGGGASGRACCCATSGPPTEAS